MEDEREPGLDFSLCFVYGSRPWGAAALLLCLFILLLKCLNVRWFPLPSSQSTNFATEFLCQKIAHDKWLNFYSLLQDDRMLLWLKMLEWVLFHTHMEQ